MDSNTKQKTFPISELKDWFLENMRSLPWREKRTPYSVWISEIMLQQTQANVVKPYFEAWMKEFPTVEALADSSIEKVIKLWEGLGYYSRARNLHAAAVEIVKRYEGVLPDKKEELAEIKGIGPYTMGAILSFAYNKKCAAVDGNVLRLLSRFYQLDEPIDLPKTRKQIEELTLSILPDTEPWILMEAMIELGALICKKNPLCDACPIKKKCISFRNQTQNLYPIKMNRQKVTFLERHVGLIFHKRKILVQKGERGKIMADLYQFPYFEKGEEALNIEHLFGKKLKLELTYVKELPKEQHTFTRYRALLFPHLMKAKEPCGEYEWKDLKEVSNLAFSSGHRRILNNFLKNETITH